MVQQGELRADHIEDADDGERSRVRLARRGVDRRGSRRSVAPAEHVRADDEELLRVQRAPRPDELLPPAGRWILARRRGVRGPGQPRVQQYRIVARGRQRPPGLVCDVKLRKRRGVGQRERLRVVVRLVGGRGGSPVRRLWAGGRGVR